MQGCPCGVAAATGVRGRSVALQQLALHQARLRKGPDLRQLQLQRPFAASALAELTAVEDESACPVCLTHSQHCSASCRCRKLWPKQLGSGWAASARALRKARPCSMAQGTGPYWRESVEFRGLSPSSQTWPWGTCSARKSAPPAPSSASQLQLLAGPQGCRIGVSQLQLPANVWRGRGRTTRDCEGPSQVRPCTCTCCPSRAITRLTIRFLTLCGLRAMTTSPAGSTRLWGSGRAAPEAATCAQHGCAHTWLYRLGKDRQVLEQHDVPGLVEGGQHAGAHALRRAGQASQLGAAPCSAASALQSS